MGMHKRVSAKMPILPMSAHTQLTLFTVRVERGRAKRRQGFLIHVLHSCNQQQDCKGYFIARKHFTSRVLEEAAQAEVVTAGQNH